jgi:uncharacterized protein DUF3560
VIYSIPLEELVGVPVSGLRAQVLVPLPEGVGPRLRPLLHVEEAEVDGEPGVRWSWHAEEGEYDWKAEHYWLRSAAVTRARAEDLRLDVEIPEPRDTTYRERREARADRLEGWAEKRATRAEAGWEQANTMADAIPFGQPILVGHHSEKRDRNYRARIAGKMDRALEDQRKAESMAGRAGNIRVQVEHAVYSDDEGAVEALEVKVAGLEAERQRIKDYNASVRRGTPDFELLDEGQRASLASTAQHSPYLLKAGKKGGWLFPSYASSNLSGLISKTRKRVEELKAKAVRDEALAALVEGREGRTEW